MNKVLNRIIIVGLVLILLMIGLLAWRLLPRPEVPAETTEPAQTTETTAPTEATKYANPAPDFTFYDGDGNPHKLSDFQGKPVILNFWASWCYPCQSEMPDFQEFYLNYGEDIHFIMLNQTDGYTETVDSAKAFLENMAYTFPVYFDTQLEGSYLYGVNSIPVTWFIDAEGNLIAKCNGTLNASILQQGIDMITK